MTAPTNSLEGQSLAEGNAYNIAVAYPREHNVIGGVSYCPRRFNPKLPNSIYFDLTVDGQGLYRPLGYLTDDGVSKTVDISSDTAFAWGGIQTAVLKQSVARTFQFGLKEFDNALVQALIVDDENVSRMINSAAKRQELVVREPGTPSSTEFVFVFDFMSKGKLHRQVIPCAQITAIDEQAFNSQAETVLNVTVACIPDEEGNSVYLFIEEKPGQSQNIPAPELDGFTALEPGKLIDPYGYNGLTEPKGGAVPASTSSNSNTKPKS